MPPQPILELLMPKTLVRRSLRQNKSLLLCLLILLTLVTLTSMGLIVLRGMQDTQENRIAEFVERRERLEMIADQVSSRLMQFVDLYEGIWSFHEREPVPVEKYRQALIAQNGVVQTTDDLTAVPFTIVSSLTKASEVSRLSLYLKLVRSVSAAPSIDARKLGGVRLSGELYAPDGAFFASSPALSDMRSRALRQEMRDGTVKHQVDSLESEFVRASGGEIDRRPLWVSTHRAGTDAVATIMIPILKDNVRVAMLAVNIPGPQFVQHFRNQENRPGFYVFSQDGEPLRYGTDIGDDRRVIHLVRANKSRILDVKNRTQVYWIDGNFIISQRVAGPGWIAVYAIPWPTFVAGIARIYWVAAGFAALSLVLIWACYVAYRYVVARPIESEMERVVELEAFRRGVLETLPVGVIVFSIHRKQVLYTNSLAYLLLGTQQPSQVINFCETVLSREVEPAGASEIFEFSWRRSDSNEIDLGLTISRERFDGDDAILIGVMDLSDRKAKEILLEEARARAERDNRTKTLFVAGVSHEIRTPLHGAMGNLELLATGDLTAEQRRRLEVIQRSFSGLLRLVDDVLDITKLDAGALTVSPRSVIISETISSCAENFAPTILARGLTFSCSVDPALDQPIWVDDHRLSQILQNLLSNAAKFTLEGGVSVRARLARGDALSKLVVEVQDTGIGISENAKRRLFHPLEQGDTSISARFGGTGLGLYLCRQLVSLMGGIIEVSSELGEGARFRFEIPIQEGDVAEMSPYHLSGLRIVVSRTGAASVGSLIARLQAADASVSTDRTQACDIAIATYDVGVAEILGAEPSARDANPSRSTLILTPDGPLRPKRIEPTTWHLTSLNPLSLLEFLGEFQGGTSVCPVSIDVSEPSSAFKNHDVHTNPIIIADDDEVSRVLLRDQLSRLGYLDVRSFDNGADVVLANSQRDADLILVDLNMPILDGAGVAEKLRGNVGATKVVVVTAAGEGNLVDVADLFSGVLHKPVTMAALSVMLAKHLPEARMMGTPQGIADEIVREMRKAFVAAWADERSRYERALQSHEATVLKKLLHKMAGGMSALGEDDLAHVMTTLHAKIVDPVEPCLEKALGDLLKAIDERVSNF